MKSSLLLNPKEFDAKKHKKIISQLQKHMDLKKFVKGDVGSKTTSRTSKQIFFWKCSREGLYHLLIKGST